MKHILPLILLAGSALGQSAHKTTLSCTPATTGGTPTSYNFKMSLTHGGPYTTLASPTTCAYVDSTGLIEGQTRYYVVTAVNSAGESGPSQEVSATTPFSLPATPAGLKAVPE